MSDNAPFWMSRLKVERARDLIKELERELENYRRNPPIEYEVGSDEKGVFAAHTIRHGPFKAAPMIGDIIHNLRASLDLMAVELVRASNGNDNKVYFPMATSEVELDRQIRETKFDRAGADAVALLKSFAPYRGGNIALRAIHDLDIEDKHKALVPTHQQIVVNANFQIVDGKISAENIQVSHDPDSLKLVFPDDSAFGGNEVVPMLENLVQIADGILEAFAALVAARG